MPKRCANIHKRKDNRWEGRIKIGKYPNGATKYHSVYGKTYTEVKEKLDFLKANDNSLTKVSQQPKLFSDVVSLWLTSIKITVKKATLYRYEYLAEKHILPILGKFYIHDITSEMINEFLDNKLKNGKLNGKGGLSPTYVKSMANIIKSIIEYAADEGFFISHKIRISNPVKDKCDVLILSHQDQKKLKDYIDLNMSLTGLGIIISLYAGLRIGEICALRWEDIDLNSGIIHIRHTVARIKSEDYYGSRGTRLILDKPKTKSSKRDIPISTMLMPYLIDAQKEAMSNYVISDKREFVSPRTFEYRYHKIIKNSINENINYHALRHTFATRCVESNVDIKSLSEILGHSSVSVTLNTYVHSSLEMKRAQLEKMLA